LAVGFRNVYHQQVGGSKSVKFETGPLGFLPSSGSNLKVN